jgi:thioredoxin reductase (NADPH)
MFPVLEAGELARMRRFGTVRRHADGERLIGTGKQGPGMFVVLSGVLRIIAHDRHGRAVPVADLGAGGFSGEIGQLSGQRSFVDGVAAGAVETLLIVPEQLRALLIAEAALGQKIMRALILRRVGLIEAGSGGPVLVGSPSSPDVARLRTYLSRNGIPYAYFDADSDPDARAMIERYAPRREDMPLVFCPDGSVLRNPRKVELARRIGMLGAEDADRIYDVAIVGAGPAGLAAAVYAASEGASVMVIDARFFGGQAGASARIENYLGFPTGISGMALAGRAYNQAQKFGARMRIPTKVVRLDCGLPDDREPFELQLADTSTVRSRAVVIATGARYRRPQWANLKAMEGRGVWYWASPIEARMCAGQEVVLVGGGNSAGQAAVFLAGHASRVWLLVRGAGLEASMSRYLIDRITAVPNIEVRTRTEIAEIGGSRQSGVESVRWRHRDTGQEETRAIRNVFLFLGADPETGWLKDCGVALDEKGFVRTGPAVTASESRAQNGGRLPLETSQPGVFAIGDVRAGSVKRVGSAIGEGAAVVGQIHGFIVRQSAADTAPPKS